MQNYFTYNAQGVILSSGLSIDGTLPAGAIVCTAAQAVDPGAWCVSLTAPPAVVAAPAAQLLATAQAAQTALLNAAYQAAITAPISYTTAAGTTAIFNQTETAKANLQDALLASEKAGVWSLNVWQSAAGAIVTPFTYADLQGLAAAMEAVDAPDYQTLLGLLAQVAAATTVEAVQAVVW
jgi:hypothetical protein